MEKKPGKKEIIFLIVIFIIILAGWLGYRYMTAGADPGNQVRITVNGEEYGVYDLEQDQEIPIEIDGEVANTLVIKDGEADMIEADCPDQICVNTAAISVKNETIVCLPNKVVVEVIESEAESELDVIAQ
ncbi:MAG: NusG domain II-containing protein [Lachnospiraceae bacterium]|nr:NusG domain II-containing protein [Lachnospiraceae bacterium]